MRQPSQGAPDPSPGPRLPRTKTCQQGRGPGKGPVLQPQPHAPLQVEKPLSMPQGARGRPDQEHCPYSSRDSAGQARDSRPDHNPSPKIGREWVPRGRRGPQRGWVSTVLQGLEP